MVDWKRMKVYYEKRNEEYIDRHGVHINEVYNAINGITFSKKKSINDEVRYEVLGESYGRVLMIILVQRSRNEFQIINAYEPSEKYKKLYKNKCGR